MKSQFAFGQYLNGPVGLAIDGTGDLFVGNSGNIVEITAGGAQSVWAPGSSGNELAGLAFQPIPEPSVLGLLGVSASALFIRRPDRFGIGGRGLLRC